MLVVPHKGVLLEYIAQNLLWGGNDGDMDTRNQGEGRMNESNNDRVVKGADEDDNMSTDSNDETLTDGMKGIILVFK